jgi:hypothetical protein
MYNSTAYYYASHLDGLKSPLREYSELSNTTIAAYNPILIKFKKINNHIRIILYYYKLCN